MLRFDGMEGPFPGCPSQYSVVVAHWSETQPMQRQAPPTNCWLVGGWLFGVALCGCQTVLPHARPTQFNHQVVRGQLVLHSDFPLPAEHRLIDDLLAVRSQVRDKLGLTPSDEPVHIYLFADAATYDDFLELRFPGFINRRALFVETDVALSVYAHWGDHVAEDLRHEVVHGYLHASLPNLPLWLDEGLAEYFEVPRSRHGLNEAHVDFLSKRTGKTYSLSRLEQLTSAEEMTQDDYAESWAWVYFLLESTDDRKTLLTDYLADLGQGSTVPTMSARLHKRLVTPELTLAEHLKTETRTASPRR